MHDLGWSQPTLSRCHHLGTQTFENRSRGVSSRGVQAVVPLHLKKMASFVSPFTKGGACKAVSLGSHL